MNAAPRALAAALLLAACGTGRPERPLRDTCAGGACDAIPAGNAAGTCSPPADAQAEDVSTPTTVVGTGTPASCTGEAFVAAVAAGGVITFDCGPAPVTIHLTRTAKVFNDRGPKVVIDGGGLVTLSGGGRVRILYQDTCDPAQVWTTPTARTSRRRRSRCSTSPSPTATRPARPSTAAAAAPSSPGVGGSRWSAAASSATPATRSVRTWAAAPSGP